MRAQSPDPSAAGKTCHSARVSVVAVATLLAIAGSSGALAAACANTASSGPGKATGRSYPVWMSRDFTLGKHARRFEPSDRAAWTRYFAQPFLDPDGNPETFTASVWGEARSKTRKEMSVGDCNARFEADRHGYGVGLADAPIYDSFALFCYAALAITRMTPSAASYVSDFRLTPKTVGELPVVMRMALSPDESDRLAEEARKGYVLRDEMRGATVQTSRSGNAVSIAYPDGDSQGLTILAKDDYTHDGVQDLLVATVDSTTGGGGRPGSWRRFTF